MIPELDSGAAFRIRRRLAGAVLARAPAAAVAQSEGAVIHLGVGQQKTLAVGNVQRVAIGDPEIADVKQVGGGNELLLTGVGEGRTSLLVWQRSDRRLSYAVVVRRQDPRELVSEIRALLGDREGIRARVVGDRVYLDGETLTGDDQDRVQQVLSLYPQIRSFVRPSSSAKRLTAASLNRAVQRTGLWGVRFDEGAQRVLSQPRLLCASGEKAEFTAGGELPVLIATQNQFAVEFKKFGVVLQVTPTADRAGNIATEVYAGVSNVDRTLSVRANGFDVPGLRLREVRTNVTVKDGETIILSGLFSYDEAKEVSKVPLLGSIPILGELFKSRQFVERKTQLAIYVTPRLVSPDSGRVQELIRDGHKTYQDAAARVAFSLFD